MVVGQATPGASAPAPNSAAAKRRPPPSNLAPPQQPSRPQHEHQRRDPGVSQPDAAAAPAAGRSPHRKSSTAAGQRLCSQCPFNDQPTNTAPRPGTRCQPRQPPQLRLPPALPAAARPPPSGVPGRAARPPAPARPGPPSPAPPRRRERIRLRRRERIRAPPRRLGPGPPRRAVHAESTSPAAASEEPPQNPSLTPSSVGPRQTRRLGHTRTAKPLPLPARVAGRAVGDPRTGIPHTKGTVRRHPKRAIRQNPQRHQPPPTPHVGPRARPQPGTARYGKPPSGGGGRRDGERGDAESGCGALAPESPGAESRGCGEPAGDRPALKRQRYGARASVSLSRTLCRKAASASGLSSMRQS